ncbi:response regulator transcription factor [Lachnospiraceae bacterium 54-53]
MRILIIEDEARLAMTLADIVTYAGYNADVSMDGKEGLISAVSGIYDAVILDDMLQGLNAYSLLFHLRNQHMTTPVLMLTAKTGSGDQGREFHGEADDYLTKPFENSQLLACLRTILCRRGEVPPAELYFVDLKLTPSLYELRCRSNKVLLSARELDVMQMLMANSSQYLSKKSLLLKIWGYDRDVNENNVEAYISFLRKKLLLLESSVHITVVRKVGYRLMVRRS